MKTQVLKALIFMGVMALACFAQVPVILAPLPQLQFFDQSGRPLAFGCVFAYQSGTTTPLATYTDYTGATLNQNPVILSAGGSANIWLQAGQAYRLKVKGAGGVQCFSGATEYTVDGIGGAITTLTTVVTYSSTPIFIVQSQNQLFEITLTGDATSQPLSVSGVIPPGWITWQITQDGAGGHAFSWPSGTIGGCTIGSLANQVTTQTFIWNGTNATAIGPCTVGIGPAIHTGSISASGNITTSGVFSGTGLYTQCANPALSGFLRLCKTESVMWRNEGNTADQGISQDSSDRGLWSFDAGLLLSGSTPNLLFGGTTSSFPMFKRDSRTIQARLADDSNDADVQAGKIIGNTSVTAGVVQIHGTATTGQVLAATSSTDAQWSSNFVGGTNQFISVSPGCTASGSPCTVLVTWATAFADSAYYVICSPTSEAASSVGAFWIDTKTTTTFTINIDNRGTNNPGGFNSFDCFGHRN